MAKIVFLLILVGCSLATAQPLSPADYAQYEGYFLNDGTVGGPMPEFGQLELRVTMTADSMPVLRGFVFFFSDTLVTSVDTQCRGPVQIIYIAKDSLHFRTEDCLGESYEFKGRFLGAPVQFDGRQNDPALEGILFHRKDNRLLKKYPVRFRYSVGC